MLTPNWFHGRLPDLSSNQNGQFVCTGNTIRVFLPDSPEFLNKFYFNPDLRDAISRPTSQVFISSLHERLLVIDGSNQILLIFNQDSVSLKSLKEFSLGKRTHQVFPLYNEMWLQRDFSGSLRIIRFSNKTLDEQDQVSALEVNVEGRLVRLNAKPVNFKNYGGFTFAGQSRTRFWALRRDRFRIDGFSLEEDTLQKSDCQSKPWPSRLVKGRQIEFKTNTLRTNQFSSIFGVAISEKVVMLRDQQGVISYFAMHKKGSKIETKTSEKEDPANKNSENSTDLKANEINQSSKKSSKDLLNNNNFIGPNMEIEFQGMLKKDYDQFIQANNGLFLGSFENGIFILDKWNNVLCHSEEFNNIKISELFKENSEIALHNVIIKDTENTYNSQKLDYDSDNQTETSFHQKLLHKSEFLRLEYVVLTQRSFKIPKIELLSKQIRLWNSALKIVEKQHNKQSKTESKIALDLIPKFEMKKTQIKSSSSSIVETPNTIPPQSIASCVGVKESAASSVERSFDDIYDVLNSQRRFNSLIQDPITLNRFFGDLVSVNLLNPDNLKQLNVRILTSEIINVQTSCLISTCLVFLEVYNFLVFDWPEFLQRAKALLPKINGKERFCLYCIESYMVRTQSSPPAKNQLLTSLQRLGMDNNWLLSNLVELLIRKRESFLFEGFLETSDEVDKMFFDHVSTSNFEFFKKRPRLATRFASRFEILEIFDNFFVGKQNLCLYFLLVFVFCMISLSQNKNGKICMYQYINIL